MQQRSLPPVVDATHGTIKQEAAIGPPLFMAVNVAALGSYLFRQRRS